MRNPIFFAVIMLFTILNVIDGITALFILPGETNPIFLLTGSIWVLLIYKVFVTWLVWWVYNKQEFPNNFTYFLTTLILVFGCLGLGLGIYSNVYGMMHEEAVRFSATQTTGQKLGQYSIMVTVFMILPMIFNLITFWVYDKTKDKVFIKNG
jgi:hypothetical protein